MRLILLGAPGVGKGTQGMKLAEFYHIPKLSTGEILRNAIASGSRLGKEVAVIMNQGMLVADYIVEEIVSEKLHHDQSCANGFILDGFPRTLGQAEALTSILSTLPYDRTVSVNIALETSEMVKRLASRMTCASCGHTFDAQHMHGDNIVCMKCGSTDCAQRPDDKEEAIVKRMKVYDEQTKPVIDYYRGKPGWLEVNGLNSIESVFHEILHGLGEKY